MDVNVPSPGEGGPLELDESDAIDIALNSRLDLRTSAGRVFDAQRAVAVACVPAQTLGIAGNGVLFTGITLAVGVGTWIFAPIKFQADMGILLTFMFLVNMIGAVLLLPALATVLFRSQD